MPNPVFPGHILVTGSTDTVSIALVQRRLNDLGYGPLNTNGVFDAATFASVELFQAHSVDALQKPLDIDGAVGPLTWQALFGSSLITEAPSPLLTKLLDVASAEVGVMEDPPSSNRGPRVDQYISTTGLNPASGNYAWCACFVYWCFQQAATTLGVPNPDVKSAGVLEQWDQAAHRPSAKRFTAAQAKADTSLVVPGTLFLIQTSGEHGHMGIIEAINGNIFTTLEGNTNQGGSPDGVGVFRRTGRSFQSINLGYVLYS